MNRRIAYAVALSMVALAVANLQTSSQDDAGTETLRSGYIIASS